MEASQGGKNRVNKNGDVRYRGFVGGHGRSPQLRYVIRRGMELDWLGTFETAEEAEWAYDRAAFAFRRHSAILDFPNEDQYQTPSFPPSSASSSRRNPHRERGSEVIEFEYLDNKLLEDLLDTQDDRHGL
ncbi:putative Integrase-type DNA-binding superfamily protein [Hibiscus syriacus]|uniref:Integrase-type DNA-binding superfamily protein n=1 Tax=Hibiscus syriacus TaxID=106335 RepID=A0A6A2XVW0_HIBSY|nr:putative Integrase-type DNA-binding superfamily protein [Hibiscus syriacus]